MRDMLSWLLNLSSFTRQATIDEFGRDLYQKIVACTAEAHDLPATVAALYVLRDGFGFYPDSGTMRKVSELVADVGAPTMGSWSVSTPKRRAVEKAKLRARTKKVLHLLQFERDRNVVAAGYDDHEELEEQIQQEERLFILAEFLRTMMERSTTKKDSIRTNIEHAALEMGAGGLNMEDPLLSRS